MQHRNNNLRIHITLYVDPDNVDPDNVDPDNVDPDHVDPRPD